MARYPGTLESANTNEFGIVFADQVQGQKVVASLSALYAISDAILSKSKVNTYDDALGQEWYVTSEGCKYRLDSWAERHSADGWTKLQVVDTEFDSLLAHGADKIKNFTTSPTDVTLNYNTWKNSTVNEDGTAVISAATKEKAGVMTKDDKIKLDETLPNLVDEEMKNRQEQIRSISTELGFTENPTNVFNFSPVNKDLADKDTVTDAIDFLADEKYRSEMPDDLKVPNNIGGLKSGQTAADLRKKSLSQILDDIIFPELQPTITAPSASIAFKGFSNNQILEVGSTAPVNPTNFTTGYSQGLSKVAGQTDRKRGGVLNSGSSFIFYNNSPSTTTLPEKVVLNTMTYKYRAAYEQGDVCITSKGNTASLTPNPLPAGTVDSGAIQIYGTYPYFCNGNSASSSNQDNNLPTSVTPDTKLPLQKWSDTLVGAKFASEASTGTRLVFEFPSTKRITKVEFMNTVSGKWENFPGWSTSTSGNKTVQGLSVAYSKLTTTGALSGAIQLRFTVANV